MKIVEIENISIGYGGTIILQNVNLTIKQNDFIGVIGPNGGGKTTFIKALLGLIKPYSGQIRFYKDGKPAKNLSIGYLPQVNENDKKFPITVLNVALSGIRKSHSWLYRYTTADQHNAMQLLNQLGVAQFAQKPIGELSGGQMQRVFLARALINQPHLLVLDEPNTYVDSSFEKELYEILNELNKQMAIVMVNHDLGIISSYVKSIACVNRQLHYHPSNKISNKQLTAYNCPIDLITHGAVPHRVLPNH